MLLKRVRFAASLVSEVTEVPSLYCYTEEDLDLTWYSRLEVDTITHKANELILKAEESPEGTIVRDLEGDCLRGLERKAEDGHVEAFLSRCAVYDAVLEEQDKQGKEGQVNAKKIAELCQAASRNAKFAAILRAKQDEADVQLYFFVEVQVVPKQTKKPGLIKECSLTALTEQDHLEDAPEEEKDEQELALMDVFSKSSPALCSHSSSLSNPFHKEANRSFSVRADDSWITRGTEATACESISSCTSYNSSWEHDLDHSEDHSDHTPSVSIKRPFLIEVNPKGPRLTP